MIKAVFTTLFLITTSATFSCELTLADKVFVAENAKVNNWQDLVIKSTCNEELELKAIHFITGARGHVRTTVMKEEASLANITIAPERIHVQSLTSFTKSQLQLPSSFEMKELSTTDGAKFISLTNMDHLKVACEQCQSLGETTLKFLIERSGQIETKWARTTIAQRVNAYFPRRHIAINQKYLSGDDFEAREVLTSKPSELFSDLSQIEFFSTVRALNPEAPVKQTDLYAQNLVTPQNLVEVVLSTGKMTLSTKGYPTKVGRYGEVINIRNANSNRLISAKVIGRNKVVVE